jgi:hypothetical protein
MKQTRQRARAIKQSIYLDVYGNSTAYWSFPFNKDSLDKRFSLFGLFVIDDEKTV